MVDMDGYQTFANVPVRIVSPGGYDRLKCQGRVYLRWHQPFLPEDVGRNILVGRGTICRTNSCQVRQAESWVEAKIVRAHGRWVKLESVRSALYPKSVEPFGGWYSYGVRRATKNRWALSGHYDAAIIFVTTAELFERFHWRNVYEGNKQLC